MGLGVSLSQVTYRGPALEAPASEVRLAAAGDPDFPPRLELSAPPLATYVVEQYDTLSEISIKLYGTSRRWREIARWNGLEDPHKIRSGKRLLLEEAPTVEPEVGNVLLVEMWRHRFGVDIERPGPKSIDEARTYLARKEHMNTERVSRSLASFVAGSIDHPRAVINEPTHKADLEEIALFPD